MQRLRRVLAAASGVAAVLACVGAARAAVPTTKIITDPFTTDSQHATSVEPDSFSSGSTMVAAAQVGRFFDGGASDIGFATSTNGGSSFTQGTLSGITRFAGGSFDRVSDPSVAYDAKHKVWLISSIPINEVPDGTTVPKVVVSRSTDGGLTFGNPVDVAAARPGQDLDKNWTACDNHPASPFYGNCYTTFDDFGDGDRLYVSTSSDGGLTWGTPKQTADHATGLGGQPVVQPNGIVIIPASDAFEFSIIAFRSTDGGDTWSRTRRVSRSLSHNIAGNLRSGPLPSAEVDGSGRVYVVWHDCRFRAGCVADDIVLSTSTDGISWTRPVRVPIGTTRDGHDNFIPGIGVDGTSSGSSARLGVTFYFYENAACGSSCQLKVGYIQSSDGGTTWSGVTEVSAPFAVSWIADTNQGRMVGDYISTSWVDTDTSAGVSNRAFGSFSFANAPSGSTFDQAIYVPASGLSAAGSTTRAGGDRIAPSNQAALNADEHSAVRRRIR